MIRIHCIMLNIDKFLAQLHTKCSWWVFWQTLSFIGHQFICLLICSLSNTKLSSISTFTAGWKQMKLCFYIPAKVFYQRCLKNWILCRTLVAMATKMKKPFLSKTTSHTLRCLILALSSEPFTRVVQIMAHGSKFALAQTYNFENLAVNVKSQKFFMNFFIGMLDCLIDLHRSCSNICPLVKIRPTLVGTCWMKKKL